MKADLRALACEDCPAEVSVQRGQGVAGSVLVVYVVHADTCPWSAAHVPAGGATLVNPHAILRHERGSSAVS